MTHALHSLKLLALALACALAWCGPASAQGEFETKVKAAILFNLAQFVNWPSSAFVDDRNAIRLCLLDARPLAAELERGLQGRTIGGRVVQVVVTSAASELAGCHVAYVGQRDRAAIAMALKVLADRPVLTVHEADEPLAGGVVRLFVAGDRLRFEINTTAAMNRDLQISSKLLNMARVISQ